MTSLKSSGKIDFPKNLEQKWGWSHDPVRGVHRILHFLAFLLGASVTQIKAEWLPRGYLKFFHPGIILCWSFLGLPRISTPLFSTAVVLKILKSGKGMQGKDLGGSFVIAANNAYQNPPRGSFHSLCIPSLKLHWNPDTFAGERESSLARRTSKPSTQFPSSDRTCEILCSG